MRLGGLSDMANRRTAALKCRRVHHARMRRQGIIDQTRDSSMEGLKGSGIAQKSDKAWRARKA